MSTLKATGGVQLILRVARVSMTTAAVQAHTSAGEPPPTFPACGFIVEHSPSGKPKSKAKGYRLGVSAQLIGGSENEGSETGSKTSAGSETKAGSEITAGSETSGGSETKAGSEITVGSGHVQARHQARQLSSTKLGIEGSCSEGGEKGGEGGSGGISSACNRR